MVEAVRLGQQLAPGSSLGNSWHQVALWAPLRKTYLVVDSVPESVALTFVEVINLNLLV